MRLIDADVLIDHLEEVMETAKYYENTEVSDTLCGVIGVIKGEKTITIPTAELDTTNDFAEWIDVNGDGSIMKCSRCGEEVCCKNNNFCPNCGADMREGDGDDRRRD